MSNVKRRSRLTPKSMVSFEECVARMHHVCRRDTELTREEIAFQTRTGWRKANDNYDPLEDEQGFRVTQAGESLRDFKLVRLGRVEAREKSWWRRGESLGDFYIMEGGRLQMYGFRWAELEHMARMFHALHPDERLPSKYRGAPHPWPRWRAYEADGLFDAPWREGEIYKHTRHIAGFSWRAPGAKHRAA